MRQVPEETSWGAREGTRQKSTSPHSIQDKVLIPSV
jgi:hypothetical protein